MSNASGGFLRGLNADSNESSWDICDDPVHRRIYLSA